MKHCLIKVIDIVNECINENILLTTFSLIEKITELNPSYTMKSYKTLQSIAYEFMDKFNLTFKTCQTATLRIKN